MSISRTGYTIGLVCIVIAALAVRWHLIAQPLDRDEGFYAYVAQRLLHGGVPFRETFSDKPPVAFLIYSGFITILGQTSTAIHLGGAVWVAGTSVLMAQLARRLYGPMSGLAAGLFYAITSAESSYQGSSINLELLLTPLAVAALLLLARPVVTMWSVAGAGWFLGLALLTKQQAIGHAAFAAAWLLVRWLMEPPRSIVRLIKQQLLLMVAALAVFGCSVLVFWLCNGLDEYIDGMLLWNLKTYVPHEPASAAWRNFSENFRAIALANPLLYVAGVAGLWISLRRPGAARWFAPLWIVANAAAICIGWRFYRHYFLFTQPGVVLLAACAAGRVIEWSIAAGRVRAFGVKLSMVAVMLSPLAIQFEYFFRWSAWEHVRRLYGPESFAESQRLAEYVAENSSPGDSIFVHGSEPQIYFLSQRRCAIRYAFIPPLTARGPVAAQRQREAMEQCRRARPKFLLVVASPMSHMTEYGASKYFEEQLVAYSRQFYVGVVSLRLLSDRAEYQFGTVDRPLIREEQSGTEMLVLQRRD